MGSASFEQRAGASETRLGLLEFGNVDRRHVEAALLDAGAGARKRRRKDDGIAERQSVGGVRLLRSDIDPVIARELLCFEPGATGEQGVLSQKRDCRLQMQASKNWYRNDFVAIQTQDGAELANTFLVAACRLADKQSATDAQDVAAFQFRRA